MSPVYLKKLIYISDNCSNDNTSKVDNKFISDRELGNVRYSCNPINLGFDGNVLKCYQDVGTDYIWILSDDDFLFVNKLDTLLGLLGSYDIICLNDLLDTGKFGLSPVKSEISIIESDRWEAVSKFLWISRFLVKRRNLDYESLTQYLGTGLMHLAIINHLFVLKEKTQFMVTDFAILKNQPHCIFSHNFMDVFVNSFYNFFMIPDSQFSNDLALKVARANLPFVVNSLLAHKVGSKVCKYNFDFFYLIKKMLKYKCSYGLIIKFIAYWLAPANFIRMIKKANKPYIEYNEKRTYI